MKTVSEIEARDRLYELVDYVGEHRAPVQIIGQRYSAVLISEEEWRSIQEVLFRTAVPGAADAKL